jgi:hypothetical protein
MEIPKTQNLMGRHYHAKNRNSLNKRLLSKSQTSGFLVGVLDPLVKAIEGALSHFDSDSGEHV